MLDFIGWLLTGRPLSPSGFLPRDDLGGGAGDLRGELFGDSNGEAACDALMVPRLFELLEAFN